MDTNTIIVPDWLYASDTIPTSSLISALQSSAVRDGYGALTPTALTCAGVIATVNALVKAAASADKIDEHGAWSFGCEFDKKGRGHALNWDAYAVANDVHSGALLAVIQIRQFIRQRKNGFGNVRKSYFLLGTNEDGTTFAHCVEAKVVHHAIKTGQDPVLAAQNWMFGGNYAGLIRQGDLAMYPVKAARGEKDSRRTAVLEGSHRLKANIIKRDADRLYAKNPSLVHLPGTHPDVAGQGWFRIVSARRASHWDFAPPTID